MILDYISLNLFHKLMKCIIQIYFKLCIIMNHSLPIRTVVQKGFISYSIIFFCLEVPDGLYKSIPIHDSFVTHTHSGSKTVFILSCKYFADIS